MLYLVSTVLFSPLVRGTLGDVKHIEIASEAAVERRKQEVVEDKNDKRDMLHIMLVINADRGERIKLRTNTYIESHSSM